MGAIRAPHGESPDSSAVIHANLLLLGIESHALANQMIAVSTPHIKWHLKADDQYTLVQLLCPLPEGMLPTELRKKGLLN